ncbi:3-phosphoshikimate 1-carboxyvinyltransferase [Clostridium thermarum]|uniref:3-phosphoshikimate 1-carboxyvinyltransferase n=1 Tax=Clostridium thermarum TaxID=1716543 RepID=UPI00111F7DD5|nr:3-phosphoshikimate 1-carboxyvinyltransferase [Clostridium thermarum]
MSSIEIRPGSYLQGTVKVPSSKSIGHRALICAALSQGNSTVENINLSRDIKATTEVLESLGAKFFTSKNSIEVTGTPKLNCSGKELFCDESGSTLRFLIPIALLQDEKVTFNGRGKLVERPLTPYYKIFDNQQLYYKNNNGLLPLELCGKIKPGVFNIKGNVSSQFISGLMFALPLLDEDSTIVIDGNLESRPYVDLTIDVLKDFGVSIVNKDYKSFIVRGKQRYCAKNYSVEGDFSQAAFFIAGGLLNGSVLCTNLKMASLQGDKAIVDIGKLMGGKITVTEKGVLAEKSALKGTDIDASQVPDLVPILTVLAALSEGQTIIYNAARLRIKECDRLQAISTELNKLGADITEKEDSLIINGVKSLKGGIVSSWNDHRIVMAMTIASMRAEEPVIIEDYKAVEKSYPHFYSDFTDLGGQVKEF